MVRVQDKISLNLQTFLQILKITFSEKKNENRFPNNFET